VYVSLYSRHYLPKEKVYMRKRSTGLVSLLVAGALVTSPVVATSAFADDTATETPIEAAPAAETTPDTAAPVEPVAETPAESPAPVETEAAPAPVPAETAPEAEAPAAAPAADAPDEAPAEAAAAAQTPGAPEGLRFDQTSNDAGTLSWNAPAVTDDHDAATSYDVYIDESRVGNTSDTYYQFSDLSVGGHFYTVIANNAAGNDPSSIASGNFDVVAATSAPAAPRIESIGRLANRSLSLNWSQSVEDPQGGFSAAEYYDVVVNGETVGTTTATNFPIGPLKAGSYEISVVAINANGFAAGPAISYYVDSTIPDAPSNIVISDGPTPDSVKVSWDAPYDGGEESYGYWINIATNGGETFNFYSDPEQTSDIFYIGNQPGRELTASVYTVNRLGNSPTGTSSAYVQPVNAPSAPQNFEAARTEGSNAVNLTWTAPAETNGGDIEAYVIRWEGNGRTDQVTVPASDLSYTADVTNVSVGYNFTITAVNSAGESETASIDGYTPGYVLATAPESVEGYIDGDTAIINWSEPAYNGGDANALYRVILNGSDGNSYETSSFTPNASIKVGNKPGVKYTAFVSVINEAGESNTSPAGEFRADAIAPSAPRYVSVSTRGYASHDIVTNWSTPETDGGSAILNYRVVLTDVATGATYEQIVDANTYSYTFTNFAGETEYSVQVFAENGFGGITNGSEAKVVTTNGSVPPAPAPDEYVGLPAATAVVQDGSFIVTVEGAQPGDVFLGYIYPDGKYVGGASVTADGKLFWNFDGFELAEGLYQFGLVDLNGNAVGFVNFAVGPVVDPTDPTTPVEPTVPTDPTVPTIPVTPGTTPVDGGIAPVDAPAATDTGDNTITAGDGSVEAFNETFAPNNNTTTATDKSLAYTGSDTAGAAQGGLAAMLLGGLLLAVTKVRRKAVIKK
jgi:hypothetical protein